jgi:O-succinylbenzoate synthase
MKIERVTLRQISMPLVHFFETSFGRTTERHMVLVEVHGEGGVGRGDGG